MVETLARSNRSYEAIISVEFENDNLTAIKIINNEVLNKVTVDALCYALIYNAVTKKNLSQGIGFGIGATYNGFKCSIVRTDEKQYLFSFR